MLTTLRENELDTRELLRVFGIVMKDRPLLLEMMARIEMHEKKIAGLESENAELKGVVAALGENVAYVGLHNLRFQGKVGVHVPSIVEYDERRAAPSMFRPAATPLPTYNPFRPVNPVPPDVPTVSPVVPDSVPNRIQTNSVRKAPMDPGEEPTIPVFTQHVALMGCLFAAPLAVQNGSDSSTQLCSDDDELESERKDILVSTVKYYEPSGEKPTFASIM